jgi:hypothetical protein
MREDSVMVTWEVYDEHNGFAVATHSAEFDDFEDFWAFVATHYEDSDYAVRIVSSGCLVGV